MRNPDVAQMCEEGGYFILPPRLLIRLTGKDRLRYLNGQVTNDLRKLQPGHAMPACLLTAKGKLSAWVHIVLEEEAILIEAEESLREELPIRLERYIVADDVTVDVIPTPPETIHIFGVLAAHPELEKVPAISIQRLGLPGKDIKVSSFSLLPILEKKEPISPDIIEIIRIRNGIPKWGFELTPDTLPPEAHLESSSIDYEKGCYLGQEVISRLKSVGHVNRLLRRFVAEGTSPLISGMLLFSLEDRSRSLGVLTSVTQDPASKEWVALGYLRRGFEKSSLVAVDPSSDKEALLCLS